MAPFGKYILLCSLLLALFACPGYGTLNFSSEPFPVTASDYNKILNRWTRFKESYPNQDTRVFVTATYHSWEWREAAVALMAKEQNRSEADAEAMRAEERASYEQAHEFFVRFHTQPRKLNDLQDPDSQWRISLIDDQGREILANPEDIKRLSDGLRGLDAPTRILHPYADNFSYHYRIRFPRVLPDGTPVEPTIPGGRLTLRFSSAVTRIELNWIAAE